MCLKLFKPKPPEPVEPQKPTDFPIYQMSFMELKRNLKKQGLELMLKDEYIPDYWVRYTNEESWAKIAPFLVSPAEYYVYQGCNCDDYALMASAKSSFEFDGLNGCYQCWGNIPGEHAWSLVVVSPNVYRMFEPNAGYVYAGQLFDAGEYEYQPEAWK